MTHEAFEAVELGQAETLIEVGMWEVDEEMYEKYVRGAAPYIECE